MTACPIAETLKLFSSTNSYYNVQSRLRSRLKPFQCHLKNADRTVSKVMERLMSVTGICYS